MTKLISNKYWNAANINGWYQVFDDFVTKSQDRESTTISEITVWENLKINSPLMELALIAGGNAEIPAAIIIVDSNNGEDLIFFNLPTLLFSSNERFLFPLKQSEWKISPSPAGARKPWSCRGTRGCRAGRTSGRAWPPRTRSPDCGRPPGCPPGSAGAPASFGGSRTSPPSSTPDRIPWLGLPPAAERGVCFNRIRQCLGLHSSLKRYPHQ